MVRAAGSDKAPVPVSEAAASPTLLGALAGKAVEFTAPDMDGGVAVFGLKMLLSDGQEGGLIYPAAMGYDHAIFIVNGEAYTCGGNDYGQCGRVTEAGSRTTLNLGKVPGLTDIVAAEAGHQTSYFLTRAGAVYSCGQNDNGRLGRDDTPDGSSDEPNLGQIPGLPPITAVIAGFYHLILIDEDKNVWTCGDNYYGQLARDVASGSNAETNLAKVAALSNIVSAAAGEEYSAFVTEGGEAYTCGGNDYGQLGRSAPGGSGNSPNLGQVAALSNIVSVAAGQRHAIFIDGDGDVWDCGDNSDGQLGRVVESGNESTPNLGKVAALSHVKAAACGPRHSVFLIEDGTVQTCGYNYAGQLGRVTPNGSEDEPNLGPVPSLSGIGAVAAGENYSAFSGAGAVYDCGQNYNGELGRVTPNGNTSTSNLGPIDFDLAA
jgi:alpha-tubulin suppressor-like RCC1 family protein